MTRIGLPVPPGFTVTTEVCTYFYAHKKTYPKELQSQMEAGVVNMEKIMGTKFGATSGMPLLLAVRSGARDSMPGMMDTILNLGLNDQSVVALEAATKLAMTLPPSSVDQPLYLHRTCQTARCIPCTLETMHVRNVPGALPPATAHANSPPESKKVRDARTRCPSKLPLPRME